MKKKIFVRGPVLSQSGYGEQSRFALRALRSREDLFDIYVQPIPWGQTGWVWEESEFRGWMDSRILETQVLVQQKALQPDISLQITIPNEFEKLCPINIGFTAGIETTMVDPSWLQKGNEMDKILVVSHHAKDSYVGTNAQAQNRQTGETLPYNLETPVEVVWENTPMAAETEDIPGFDPKSDFNFLCVSQMGPRKNLENTIKWFVEEFIDQEVGLILKTNTRGNSKMDLEHTESVLEAILASYPERKCNVSLLHGDLSEGQMRALYEHDKVKAMINISHGEGFGLPLFEAARLALPIIAVGWSGQLDFLRHDDKDMFLRVKHELKPIQRHAVWKGVLRPDSQWAYADQGSYKMALRMMFKKHDEFKKLAEELQDHVNTKFRDEVLHEIFCDSLDLQYEDGTSCTSQTKACEKLTNRFVDNNPCCIKHMEDLLIDITKAMNKHGIPYWVDFGTLLGLVRDGGIIPWDTDVDICIMREDAEKLNLIKEELEKKGYLWDGTTTFGDRHAGLFRINTSQNNLNTADIYYWTEKDGVMVGDCFKKGQFEFPASILKEFKYIDFKGNKIRVPKDSELLLESRYGNWKEPVKMGYH